MAWKVVSSHVVDCDGDSFRDAINVWIQRPNVCSKIISCASIEPTSSNPLLNISNLRKEILHKMSGLDVEESDSTGRGSVGSHALPFKVFLRKLFPKNPSVHSIYSEMVAENDIAVIFFPLSQDFHINDREIVYKIELLPNIENMSLQDDHPIGKRFLISLHVWGDVCLQPSRTCAPTQQWLSEVLLPSLVKWTKSAKPVSDLPTSLSLIPQNEYAPLYQTLKEKYGKKLAAMWQEATDPQKYVFEDIAIATYLILLWRLERKLKKIDKLQSFIDLGCGNGLLVHILNSEGHPGMGVDVRRRKIWDLYPKETTLRESAVDPTASNTYAYDWLLGNHSDELTPWIPVLAARSGFLVRYWILPCCFYDFFAKYERCNSTSSQYEDYLTFVKGVGERCGFKVEVDVLRIPSTKRICHVGMFKTHPPDNHGAMLNDVQVYIDERKVSNGQFKARDKIEVVKNCTKINHYLQNEIINIIVIELLKTKNFVKITPSELMNDETLRQSSKCVLDAVTSASTLDDEIVQKSTSSASSTSSDDGHSGTHTESSMSSSSHKTSITRQVCMQNPDFEVFKLWNRGGTLSLEQAAGLLTEGMRMEMKKECGGLQTLLRNHHQAFEIVNGKVRLRDWSSVNLRPRRKKRKGNTKQCVEKKRACWFFHHHPDGCPRDEEHCPFLHNADKRE